MRFLTVPAKTRVPSGWRTSGRSKRKASFSRNSSSAGVLARLQDGVAVGEAAEAHDDGDVPVEDLVEGVQRVVGRELVHRPAPFLHAEVLVLERLGVGEREAEEHPLDRPEARADPDPQPALDEGEAARVAGVHLGALAVHVAAELVEHDDEGDQQARMVEVERPMVVVAARGQRDVGAEAAPDLPVGRLDLAEPQAEAFLDARAQHVGEHLLGLVDLGGGDLEMLDLEEHAQLALQALHLGGERASCSSILRGSRSAIAGCVAGVGRSAPCARWSGAGGGRGRGRSTPGSGSPSPSREGLVAGDAALDVGDARPVAERGRVDQAHLAEDVARAEGAEVRTLPPSPMLTSTDRRR